MSAAVVLGCAAGIPLLDQAMKRWALAAGRPERDAPGTLAWRRTEPPWLVSIGRARALALWLLAGALGAAVCAAAPDHAPIAAAAGTAAWAAAASNLAEWWANGSVVDWVRLWPRTRTNAADVVIVAGTALMLTAGAMG